MGPGPIFEVNLQLSGTLILHHYKSWRSRSSLIIFLQFAICLIVTWHWHYLYPRDKHLYLSVRPIYSQHSLRLSWWDHSTLRSRPPVGGGAWCRNPSRSRCELSDQRGRCLCLPVVVSDRRIVVTAVSRLVTCHWDLSPLCSTIVGRIRWYHQPKVEYLSIFASSYLSIRLWDHSSTLNGEVKMTSVCCECYVSNVDVCAVLTRLVVAGLHCCCLYWSVGLQTWPGQVTWRAGYTIWL